MAKTKAPLFSLDATGTLDKNITYKGKKHNHIAQKYSKPGAANPFESSPRQKDQRSIIRLITIHWQCMSSADKLTWNNAAKDVRFKGTGYHYFLHMAQQNLTQYLGLVGYWSMNYNVDDKIPDLLGNGHNAILAPIFPCDAPTLVDSNNKKQGKALYLEGVSTYSYIHDSKIDFDFSTTFTIAFCIKYLSYGYAHGWWQQWLISKAVSHTGYIFDLSSGKSLRFLFGNGISWATITGVKPDLNKWYHVSLSFNSVSSTYLYLDGIEISSIGPTSMVGAPSELLGINYEYKHSSFILDNLLIYNYPLSKDIIQMIFQSYNL